MGQPKKPEYTKTMAAKQLGVSVYKLNKLIAVGVLPDKPTEAQVKKAILKYAAALKKYSDEVVAAFEAGRSLRYCSTIVQHAVDVYELIIPAPETPQQFVWGVIYRHRMLERSMRA